MSIHPSLRGVDTLVGSRSVWKRTERIQALVKQGKFDPEKDSVHGLPKVRTKVKVAGAKKKKAAKEEAAGEPGTEGEAPSTDAS